MEALQTDEQITPITTIKRRRAAAGRARHRPRSFEDRGGRSPLIIKNLDLDPQPPTNTHSPTLNSEEPEIHVYPSGRRRLSIFEAMLLQGFPQNQTRPLEGNLSAQVEQVSNAVPPPLAYSLALAIGKALTASDDV